MERVLTPLDGLLLLKPRIFSDDRGAFLETFNQRHFEEVVGGPVNFVQDNESLSAKGVLRGLHYQMAPHAQGKLVHVIHGAVLDVCVDIRPRSSTYGEHFTARLDGHAKHMLWIPSGFAHGFVALEEGTLFAYKCTAYYHPASERTLTWNDPALGIDWGVMHPLVSPKDAQGHGFHELEALNR
ncbi:MAG: dTDP-4-dehydrorhamnose 3,5-epimerase [Flavobacteriales bacterium]|nr:dTDP-4-dehydrorhamnose 3,5-epimerase [Flavobacteriales bacterium]